MDEIKSLLQESGITPTPVRILVFKSLKESTAPMSLSDLEIKLETVDKSTISRTLNKLRDHQLVHSFNDGSGAMKYELCKTPFEKFKSDLHVHFYCEKCNKTTCLPSIKIPEVNLPKGYTSHGINYVITGVCAECGDK